MRSRRAARHLRVGGITLFALGGATELGGHGRTPREELAVAATGPWISIVIAAAAGLVATGAERCPPATSPRGRAGRRARRLAEPRARRVQPAPRRAARRWTDPARAAVARPARPPPGDAVTSVLGVALGAALVVAIGARLVAGGGTSCPVSRPLPSACSSSSALRRASAASSEPAGPMRAEGGPARAGRGHRPRTQRPRRRIGRHRRRRSALSVPMPFVEYRPGGATPIEPLVAIDGAETTPLDGRDGAADRPAHAAAPVQLVAARLDRDRELLPLARVYPQGVDRQVYLARERERFDRQFDVAAAVGAAAAGVPLEVITAVVVLEVDPDGPSAGGSSPG
jgi:hypothetical protein